MGTIILKVLILGGTSFLGPYLIQELQQQGHEVTIFTRGNRNVDFPCVEKLQGDRDGHLESLKGRSWDAIIDTSGHLPRIVRDSSKFLAYSTKHYTFISTIGVYRDFYTQNIDESYPVAPLADEKDEEITDKTYGALKAACEEIIHHYFPNHCLIIRPGLIVGPLDPTDRFSYWPLHLIEGGEILAPGSPNQPIQFIDVRDLAQWIVTMVEHRATGTYNATGPATPLSFEQLLKTCQQMSTNDSSLTWVSEDFLIKHQIQDWVELPLWLSYKRTMPGFLNININKALQAGLTFRPLSETLSAIIAWDTTRESRSEQIGLNRDKERTLLNLWKQNVR
jgi:2'-hydroxyisoflavone reductase